LLRCGSLRFCLCRMREQFIYNLLSYK
jgi:hypothetical protein